MLFIRLLALVKWASAAGGLSKCDVSSMMECHYDNRSYSDYVLQEVSEALDQRSLHYVDTADQLMTLARSMLLNAR